MSMPACHRTAHRTGMRLQPSVTLLALGRRGGRGPCAREHAIGGGTTMRTPTGTIVLSLGIVCAGAAGADDDLPVAALMPETPGAGSNGAPRLIRIDDLRLYGPGGADLRVRALEG